MKSAWMVTSKMRLAALPGSRAATEAGVPLVASSWFAVYGPAGLPADLQALVPPPGSASSRVAQIKADGRTETKEQA